MPLRQLLRARMHRQQSENAPRTLDDSERGASLFIILLMVFIMLLGGGLAIDISAKENRAQELQNAADAAALAGAQVWAEGDQAAAQSRVTEILGQNGVTADLVESIDFPTNTTVRVSLRDGSNRGLLSPFTGGLSDVSRSATASHVACVQGCEQVIVVPPVFRAVEALGSGDGFLPIPVGDRLYAVNHHSNGVACVEKPTQQRCWASNRPAFNDSTFNTADNHHPTLIGTKIYYLVHNGFNDPDFWAPPTADIASKDLVLTCFETVTDQPCLNNVTLSGEGFGALANVNGQLHVFTGSRQVFCFNPDFTPCAAHPGGLDTQVSALPNWDLDLVSFGKSDVKIVGNRIYYTVSNNGAIWIQCWNAASHAACSDFGPVQSPVTGANWYDFGRNNKVVVNRSATGVEQDFCLVGHDNVDCWSLYGGGVSTAAASNIDVLRVYMRNQGWDGGWSGISSYHAPTNQVYLVDAQRSRSFCFSFVTNSICGDSYDQTSLGVVETYGYIEESENCLIGLGDNSIFFSAKPDLSGPCDSSGGFVDLTPCNCVGEAVWPSLAAHDVDGVVEFNVRVEDPDGNEIVPTTDLLLTDVDLVDAPDVAFLRAYFNVIVDGVADPWAAGTPPLFRIIGADEPPHLTE